MGLGKSLTCIALIASTLRDARTLSRVHRNAPGAVRTGGATLIVCPVTVTVNWLDQLKEHWSGCVQRLLPDGRTSCVKSHKCEKGPCLRVYLYHGTKRCMNANVLADLDVVITTYNIVASEHSNETSPLRSINWFRVILDEAQYVSMSSLSKQPAYCGVVLLNHAALG